jgi:hypothetical protein
MEKNEIKVRKQLIDDSTMHRHRNYSLLLQQHKRARRIKRTKQFFIYTLLVAVVIVLLLSLISYILVRMERNRELKENGTKISRMMSRYRVCREIIQFQDGLLS